MLFGEMRDEVTDRCDFFRHGERRRGGRLDREQADVDVGARDEQRPRIGRKGRIDDLALFVGVGGTFEIWNPRLALESGDSDLRELAAYRLEEKGVAP